MKKLVFILISLASVNTFAALSDQCFNYGSQTIALTMNTWEPTAQATVQFDSNGKAIGILDASGVWGDEKWEAIATDSAPVGQPEVVAYQYMSQILFVNVIESHKNGEITCALDGEVESAQDDQDYE